MSTTEAAEPSSVPAKAGGRVERVYELGLGQESSRASVSWRAVPVIAVVALAGAVAALSAGLLERVPTGRAARAGASAHSQFAPIFTASRSGAGIVLLVLLVLTGAGLAWFAVQQHERAREELLGSALPVKRNRFAGRRRFPLAWLFGTLLVGIAVFVVLFLLLPHGGNPPGRLGSPPPRARNNGIRPLFGLWGLALGGVVVLVVAGVVWLRRRGPVPVEDAVLVAVDESLADLERERDPRRAVIKAYARMERSFALGGMERRAAETPMEFLRRELLVVRASRGSIMRLTALFERARFSQHPIEPGMRDEALGALRALRSELASGALERGPS